MMDHQEKEGEENDRREVDQQGWIGNNDRPAEIRNNQTGSGVVIRNRD